VAVEGETITVRSMPHAFADAAVGMRRRDFITLAGGAAAGIAHVRSSALAQALPVIGYLGSETPERYGSRVSAFNEACKMRVTPPGAPSRSTSGGQTACTAGCHRSPRPWSTAT